MPHMVQVPGKVTWQITQNASIGVGMNCFISVLISAQNRSKNQELQIVLKFLVFKK
jgi:hypothetical protein